MTPSPVNPSLYTFLTECHHCFLLSFDKSALGTEWDTGKTVWASFPYQTGAKQKQEMWGRRLGDWQGSTSKHRPMLSLGALLIQDLLYFLVTVTRSHTVWRSVLSSEKQVTFPGYSSLVTMIKWQHSHLQRPSWTLSILNQCERLRFVQCQAQFISSNHWLP